MKQLWVILYVLLVPSLCIRGASASSAGEELAPGPRYVHEVWTVEDGLPVNSINRAFQGPDGYIWLATWDGLVRFDGVRFTVFNTGNSPGLPSNRIIEAIEGPDGSLWLRTEQLHLVRMRDGVFTYFDASRGLSRSREWATT